MFNRRSNTANNTSKKGARTLVERALVIMLSFMMAIQVIPFSMYGIEEMESHAATSSDPTVCTHSVDTYGICTVCGKLTNFSSYKSNWTAWTSTTPPTASGHYYLTGDVTLSNYSTPATSAKIYINLNGYKININSKDCLYKAATGLTLGLYDCNSSNERRKGAIYNAGYCVADAGNSSAFTFDSVYFYDCNKGHSTSSIIDVNGNKMTRITMMNCYCYNCKEALEGYGGGCFQFRNGCSGSLSVYDSKFEKCSSTRRGGVIAIKADVNVIMKGCELSGNSVPNKGDGVHGGGVYIAEDGDCDLTLINCDVHHNTSGYDCGAFYHNANGDFKIENCRFYNNTAAATHRGGAVDKRGSGDLTVKNSKFHDNEVTGTDARGGAINVGGSSTYYSYGGNEFYNNTSTNGAAIAIETSVAGSGFFSSGKGDYYHDNLGTNGGAIWIYGSGPKQSTYTFNDVRFYRNKAVGVAGAIYSQAKNIKLISADAQDNSSDAHGGFLYMNSDHGQTVSCDGCKFTRNNAKGGNGGVFSLGYDTNYTFNNCTFSYNRASDSGGIVGNANHLIWITMKGGSVTGCYGKNGGGAFATKYSSSENEINVSNVTFNDCSASAGSGGAAIMSGGTLTVNKCTFTNCSGEYGGGIYTSDSTTVNITNTTADACTTPNAGGFLNMYGGKAIISGGEIKFCKSTGKDGSNRSGGGAIRLENGVTLTADSVKIHDNTAEYMGGGVNVRGTSKFNMKNTSIYNNTAGYEGGGICGDSNTANKLNLISGSIYSNTCNGTNAACGGGVMVGKSCDVGDVQVYYNKCPNLASADGSSGGFGLYSGSLKFNGNCYIHDNYVKSSVVKNIYKREGTVTYTKGRFQTPSSLYGKGAGTSHCSPSSDADAPASTVYLNRNVPTGSTIKENTNTLAYQSVSKKWMDGMALNATYVPSCDGYQPTGWFTATSGGTKYASANAATPPSLNTYRYWDYVGTPTTLYYQWEEQTGKIKYEDPMGYASKMETSANMKYSTSTIAPAITPKAGWVFDKYYPTYNTSTKVFSGTGVSVGGTIRAANTDASSRTYYAKFVPAPLTYTSAESYTKYASANANVVVNIGTASNGTVSGCAYSISGNATKDGSTYSSGIALNASGNALTFTTPKAGKYVVKVQAKDKQSGAVALKTVTVTMSRNTQTGFGLSSTSGSFDYPNTATFTVSNIRGGAITVKSDNTNYATAAVSSDGKTVTVTPKAPTADNLVANITVTSPQTDYYATAEATYKYTLSRGDLTPTATAVNTTYDGNTKTAKIRFAQPNVTVRYGHAAQTTATNYPWKLTATTKNTDYNLSSCANPVNSTIYYTATADGYNNLTGQITFKITDGVSANASISSDAYTVGQYGDLTVTLNASDNHKLNSYYWGTSSTGSPTSNTITSGKTFTTTKTINAAGTYYFRVQDYSGNITTTSITTCKQSFIADSTSVEKLTYTYTITPKGKAYVYPTAAMIKQKTGYVTADANTLWHYSSVTNTTTYKVGATMSSGYVQSSYNWYVKLDEITATLKYDANLPGSSLTNPADQKMYYTKEATAGPALKETGYTFRGWNANKDGTGSNYNAGQQYKAANVIPKDATLYAKWEANALNFANISKEITSNASAQTVEISGASNGTGSYKYTIKSQLDSAKKSVNYFSITSGDSKITIVKDIPADIYTVTVLATDKRSGATKEAAYTITVKRRIGTITLNSIATMALTYPATGTRTVTAHTGTLDVKSDNQNIATAIVSGESIIVSSGTTSGSTTIHVYSKETKIETQVEKTFIVQVSKGTITPTVTGFDVQYDRKEHFVTVTSNVDNVTMYYGLDTNYGQQMTLTKAGTSYTANASGFNFVDPIDKTFCYKISKPGYNDAVGTVAIKITDSTIPEAKDIGVAFDGKYTTQQTVTLQASDLQGIDKWYWGTKANPTADDFTPLQTATQTFQQTVYVTTENPGDYIFAVLDKSGNMSMKVSKSFYTTKFKAENGTFTVNNGSVTEYTTINCGHEEIELPSIKANDGYYETSTWVRADNEEFNARSTYEVSGNSVLTATCEEKHATYHFDANGHGTDPENMEAYFTQDTLAPPAPSAEPGWDFQGWTVAQDGSGTKYSAGALLRQGGVNIPEEMTYYAQWAPHQIVFNNIDKIIETSSNSQIIEISAAAEGTGEYEYTIVSQKKDGGDVEYFTITDSNLIVEANAPVGTYTVTIHAEDKGNGSTKDAIYNITITRKQGTLEVDANELDITYSYPTVPTTFNVGKHSGAVTVTVTPTSGVVETSYDDSTGVVTVTPVAITEKTRTATITVESAQTETDNSAKKDIPVTVHQGKFDVSGDSIDASVNGNTYTAQLHSDLLGVAVSYGPATDSKPYNTIFNTDTVDLDQMSRKEGGVWPIYYTASMPGYESVDGCITITLKDDYAPETTVSCDSNDKRTSTQRVNLHAWDIGAVDKYYWGKAEDYDPDNEDIFTVLSTKLETLDVDKDVTEAGTYYFVAVDTAGNASTPAEITFFETKLQMANDAHGYIAGGITNVLTASGDSFELPMVNANTGYTAPTEWSNGIAPGAKYTPTESTTLTATCVEHAATLTYVSQHGTAPDALTMLYTQAYTAPKMEVKGYTFNGWNTSSDGTGTPYVENAVIKAANSEPENITLYAMWTVNELTFGDKTVNLDCSFEDQTFEISAAANGTDNYAYTMEAPEYFTLDGTTVKVDGNTPAGEYTLKITADDTDSLATKTATYTVKLSKIAGELELSSYEETITYPEQAEVTVENNSSGGDLSVQTNNINIATAEIDGDKITIKSGTTSGDATITVTSAATPCCEAVSKEIKVTVKSGTFTITNLTEETFELGDGPQRYATIQSDVEGVRVEYGFDDDRSNVATVGTTPVDLKNASATEADTYTIGWTATKDGYEPKSGTITFTIQDTEGPAITTTVGTDLTPKQTVHFVIKDLSKVAKYAWTTVKDPGDELYDIVPNGGEVEITLDKEITEAGTYYLYAVDSKGQASEEVALEFVKTSFVLTNGTVEVENSYTINQKDQVFNLPLIKPATGYDAPETWEDGTADGAEYTASETKTFTADCLEKHATLTYSTPRGTLPVDSVTMWYTKETTAAPAITGVKGWEFKGWNAREDLKGTIYDPEETVHEANSLDNLTDMTLYAMWEALPIELPEPTEAIELKGSSDAQFINILLVNEELYGTGNGITYTIASQPSGNYFSVTDNSKIMVSTSTPMGSFTVKIKAEDNDSHVVDYANYHITMTKDAGNIDFDTYNVSMTFPESGEINITDKTSDDITITSDNKNLLDIDRDGDKITLTPKDTGTAVLTVKVAATGMNSEATKTIDVTVNPGTFTLTATGVDTVLDGQPHFAYLKSNDVDGVTVKYAEQEDFNEEIFSMISLKTKGIDYKLPAISRTDKGTTTIHYLATKKGYNDVSGDVAIVIGDTIKPGAWITDISEKIQDNQTIKLNASDDSQIVAYYFGTEDNAESRTFTELQAGVKVFELLKEITDPGKYYFVAKDKSGELSNEVTIDFYGVLFDATYGSPALEKLLVAGGKTIELPAVTPTKGYKAATEWLVQGTDTVVGAPEEEFDPSEYHTLHICSLHADCSEITAELTYNANGHGTAPEKVTMNYTGTTILSTMENVEGYTFEGWNTKADGKGEFFDIGATFKDSNVVPEDTELFAVWSKDDEEFNVYELDGEFQADGSEHFAGIAVDVEGVTIKYKDKLNAVAGNNEYFTIANCSTDFEDESLYSMFSMLGRTDVGVVTIVYEASKPGYISQTGEITLNIIDEVKPTAKIENITSNIADNQVVTVSASDSGKLAKYYWGPKDPAANEVTFEPIFDSSTSFTKDLVAEQSDYYFQVMDVIGNVSEPIHVKFYGLKFDVTNGKAALPNNLAGILLAAGSEIALPGIEPNPGYIAATKWSNNIEVNGTYTAKEEDFGANRLQTLTAECTEMKGTLSYDSNEHGENPESVEMNYATEYRAGSGLASADGKQFVHWNTQKNGMGLSYNPGDVVKPENSDPTDITLYAIWEDIKQDEPGEEGEFTVTIDGAVNGRVDVAADGGAHSVIVKSDQNDVTVLYGTEPGKLEYTANIVTGDAGVALDKLAMVAGTETIYYKATKKGFKDVEESSVVFAVNDEVKPASLSIEFVTHTATATQKVTVSATDNVGITAFYFGLESDSANVEWISLDVTVPTFQRTDVETVPGTKNYFMVKDAAGNVETKTVEFCEWIFDVTNGSVGVQSVWVEKQDGVTNALPTIMPSPGYGQPDKWSIAGYTFGKWVDLELDVPLSGYALNTADYTIQQPQLKFSATCPEIIKTITFNANGQTATMPSNISAKYADLITAPAPTTVPAGKEFVCWSLSTNGLSQRYPANATIKSAGVLPEDITLYAIWKDSGEPGEQEPEVIDLDFSHSVTIGSDLAVNFYMKSPKQENLGGTMTFKVGPKGKEIVVQGIVKDGKPCFVCNLTINQISDNITWEYSVGNKIASSKDGYSLYTYLNLATNATNTAKYPTLAALSNKLKSYGRHAQQYLKVQNGFELGSSGDYTEVPEFGGDPTAVVPESYNVLSCDSTKEFIDKDNIKRTLSLMGHITLNLLVPFKEGNEWTDVSKVPTVTINDGSKTVTLDPSKLEFDKNGRLVIPVEDIPYLWIDRIYTITIGEDTTIKTSVMAYVYSLSNSTTGTSSRAGKAIYEFWQAAKAY